MTVIGPIDPHVCGCDSDVLLAGLISYDEALQRVMVLKLPVRVSNPCRWGGRLVACWQSRFRQLPRCHPSIIRRWTAMRSGLMI